MKSVVCIFAICVLATVGVAQEHPSVTALPNTVYVGADSKYETAPDTAVLQFNVSVQEESAQVAYQHASKDVEQVQRHFETMASNRKLLASDSFPYSRPMNGKMAGKNRSATAWRPM